MENTLETNPLKSTYWSVFASWFRQIAWPFVARWWIWIIVIVSPAYMTYFFTISPLEQRINRNLERYYESTQKKMAETRKGSNASYRLGYVLAAVVLTAIDNPLFYILAMLSLVAFLQLQYQYVFTIL